MSKQQATFSKQRSTLSKQHSTLLPQTATMSNDSIVKFRPFDNDECCFDIVAVFGDNVAGFGNNVDRNFVLSTKSKQIEHVQFVSTLSKGRNLVRHCCQKRQQCRSNILIVERIVQLVAFDNVASTLLLVWTGLNTSRLHNVIHQGAARDGGPVVPVKTTFCWLFFDSWFA